MILLTGATGNVGSALLHRLVADGRPVRALVRDPRRLGPDRVRVQIALGDLSDASSFRHALRAVTTVIHLAAAIRDQERQGATIEEVNALGTLQLVRAAERAGVEQFIFFSAIGASLHSQSRFFRAKAQAEIAVEESSMKTTVFTPSIIYSPGDPWITLLGRLAVLPVVPISGSGRAVYEPIWSHDAAAAVGGLLERNGTEQHRRFELAGPQRLSYDDIVRTYLEVKQRRRRLVHVPLPVVRWGLKAVEEVQGSLAFATWDEAELMEIPMVSERGTADAEALGVHPLPMQYVLAKRPPGS
ncbi:MAG TPA: NAD(P)H-binding protein [Thermoleophilaceae bacterium]|nr:NAD(P)H-binding protein [Thermoleophilaceae bacterium]